MSWRDLIGAWHRPKQAVSAGVSHLVEVEVDRVMIVLGADTHKRSHPPAVPPVEFPRVKEQSSKTEEKNNKKTRNPKPRIQEPRN